MATDSSVVKNYSLALLGVVQKEKLSLDVALNETRLIRQILEQHAQLRYFLAGPQFREEEKHQFVDSVFKDKISKIFYEFLHFLLKHDRIDHLTSIMYQFEELVEEQQGYTMGVITTAIDLSDEEKQQIKERLEVYCQRKFDLRFRVDPAIIGGVMVKYDDTLIDTTLATYLSDLRHRLKQVRIA